MAPFILKKATQSASQGLKTKNDKTYQPSHPHKYPERQTHELRPTAPIRQRHVRAPRPKARKKPPLEGSRPTTTGSAATDTAPTRADTMPHTKVQSPPATQARAVHGTAPPSEDQNRVSAGY